MTQKAVLLFDIDGTLIDCGGAGRRAMEQAFERIHSQPTAVAHVTFGGRTDPSIVREGLQNLGVEADQQAIDRVIEAYLESLVLELAVSSAFRVLAAVEESLDRAAMVGHAVGIGTGNVKRGATLKLAHAGLGDRFSFGGFACDAEERPELLARGRDRGLSLTGPGARVVVIGDTPRDVTAAQAIGAECLAVATGRFSMAELAAEGPTLTVADLTDPRARAFLS